MGLRIRNMKWSENTSSINGVGRSGQVHARKMKLDHWLTPYTKINSKWIKDLNIRCDTTRILEEIIGRKISDIPCSNIFTDMSPRARDIKERIDKWDYIKLKTFCMAKDNINKMERKPTVWENIFANDSLDKGLLSKVCKELTWLYTRKTIQLKNGQRTWTDTSPRRTYREGPLTNEKTLNITSHQRDAN